MYYYWAKWCVAGSWSYIRAETLTAIQDLDKDDYVPEPYTKGDVDEVYALYKEESDAKKDNVMTTL